MNLAVWQRTPDCSICTVFCLGQFGQVNEFDVNPSLVQPVSRFWEGERVDDDLADEQAIGCLNLIWVDVDNVILIERAGSHPRRRSQDSYQPRRTPNEGRRTLDHARQ